MTTAMTPPRQGSVADQARGQDGPPGQGATPDSSGGSIGNAIKRGARAVSVFATTTFSVVICGKTDV
jgi:hypothetical protein